MPQRIITGYVNGPGGRDALALATVLADRVADSRLTVAQVHTSSAALVDGSPDDWRTMVRGDVRLDLRPAEAAIGARDRTDFRLTAGRSPAEGLHRLAEELHATTIVVGVSHQHGFGRVVAGSVTEQTLHGAPCAVAVAPAGYAERATGALRTIAVAFNGSEESRRALAVAVAMARVGGSSLRIIGVVEQTAVWYGGFLGAEADTDLGGYVESVLQDAGRGVEGVDDVRVQVLHGEPVRALRDAIGDVDLLVLGSRGHGPIDRLLLGSVSSRLVREPVCPLLVIPRVASDGHVAVETASRLAVAGAASTRAA